MKINGAKNSEECAFRKIIPESWTKRLFDVVSEHAVENEAQKFLHFELPGILRIILADNRPRSATSKKTFNPNNSKLDSKD